MQKVENLFEAKAYTPLQIANLQNGNAGFRIPEYQRPYDWSEVNVKRLCIDIFSGFTRLKDTTKASAYTFLGTLILVRDKNKEPNFYGDSLSVVDGQQRLTTLTLFACALIERIKILVEEQSDLQLEEEEWLKHQTEGVLEKLGDCISGHQKLGGKNFYPFPRIVRGEDRRSRQANDEELKSSISLFLSAFEEYQWGENHEFVIPNLKDSREAKKITENFICLRDFFQDLNDPDWYTEQDYEISHGNTLNHGGYCHLWEAKDENINVQSIVAKISQRPDDTNTSLLRTLLIGLYFCKCVALTTVITDDESAAFDIFDSLNTTGEPLTAIETLKPQVIKFENASPKHSYKSSESKEAFDKIESLIEKNFPETSKKQNETKDLVVTFSLYLTGKKISRDLATQRTELRTAYEKATSTPEGPKKFMSSLHHIVNYRSKYWSQKNLGEVHEWHKNDATAAEVKLLSAFVSSTNTSLSLPILTRYWITSLEKNNISDFVEALKAEAAFLAIRRAATGGTEGIDTCFRDIMAEKKGSKTRFGLCAGVTHENEILEIDQLREALIEKLQSKRITFKNKQEWINHVVDVPIYEKAKSLSRFLLFAATHHTAPNGNDIGQLTRDGISPSDDRSYLTYENWISADYLTVEHVAPNSDKASGWPSDIYANARIRNTLGNLILLPAVENSSIGNASWQKKNIFYQALTGPTQHAREQAFQQAAHQGMKFSKTTEQLIKTGKRLSMLDGISDVEIWDAKFIAQRSNNIAGLAWDVLYKWLDPS